MIWASGKTPKNFSSTASARRDLRRREDAELAIEIAIAALEQNHATQEQLGDLADSIDALRQGQFHVSVVLSMGAQHANSLPGGKSPSAISLTLDDIKKEFSALCRDAGR